MDSAEARQATRRQADATRKVALRTKKALAEQELAGGLKPTAQLPRKGVRIVRERVMKANQKRADDPPLRENPYAVLVCS